MFINQGNYNLKAPRLCFMPAKHETSQDNETSQDKMSNMMRLEAHFYHPVSCFFLHKTTKVNGLKFRTLLSVLN